MHEKWSPLFTLLFARVIRLYVVGIPLPSKKHDCTNIKVVVVQLVERSLPTSEVRSSNPVKVEIFI